MQQNSSRKLILDEQNRHGLEPRALGRSDYPTELPLREVLLLARHCAGGIILGFEQFQADTGTWKRGTSTAQAVARPTPFPTSWNHLESGILFGLGLPLLVFKEDGITGGIFDNGVTDVFITLCRFLPSPEPIGPVSPRCSGNGRQPSAVTIIARVESVEIDPTYLICTALHEVILEHPREIRCLVSTLA